MSHMTRPVFAAIALLTSIHAVRATELDAPASRPSAPPPDRFVYVSANLLVDTEVSRVESIIDRAAAAGYTGVVLADSKFCRLADMPDKYFAHARRVRAAAQAKHIEIVPCVFPIGYSGDLLSRDPNLAEAIPVQDAVFIVKNSGASLQPEPGVSLPAGDMSDPRAWAWHDDTITFENGVATSRDPRGRNARIVAKPITLAPHRQYHVWTKVRTREYEGTPEIKVFAPRGAGQEAASLSFSSLGCKPTQDWTTHHIVFNSLGFTSVNLYFGCWDGSTGELSWDDAGIEEVGLLNVVRRAGAPLTVEIEPPAPAGAPSTSAPSTGTPSTGTKPPASAVQTIARTPLLEGADFKPVADPRMGTIPWPGGYEVYHQPPAIELLKPLPDGTRLRVSYSHAITIHDDQVMICPSEPKTTDLLRDQAVRVNALWSPNAFWMSHDEIRCLNHDQSCRSRNLTPGRILAENVKTCTAILREISPAARLYVWSDMFDPFHNARDDYYLVRGDLAGAWEGLDKDIIIACWYFDKRADSMAFFAQRGNPILIAGYYDGPPGAGVAQAAGWLAAVPHAAALRGVMYTTWERRYEDLEPFAAAAWKR
ncbi:MAG: hypothetical protein JNL50_15005 [Phycisphaerae bacterium]|nr:hypothetical protein [Phycisphaerae bacterium]